MKKNIYAGHKKVHNIKLCNMKELSVKDYLLNVILNKINLKV